MDLKTYYAGLKRGDRLKLAKQLDLFPGSLSQMATGYTKIPPKRALSIEIITEGKVTRQELLPDDWQAYWLPEELEYTAKRRREAEQ